MRRIGDWLLLTAIVVFGAVLRFSGLAVPSLWLDEILDYDVATKLTHEPFWRWLTGFASEHGPRRQRKGHTRRVVGTELPILAGRPRERVAGDG